MVKLQQPNVALVHQMPFLVLCLMSEFCVVSLQPLSNVSIVCCVTAASTEIVEDMVVKLQQFSPALVHQLHFSCPLSYVRILCCVTAASV